MFNKADVKIYHGFGHTHDLVIFGHVFKKKPSLRKKYTDNMLHNIIQLVKLFFVKPLPGMPVQLAWQEQRLDSKTETDGFFRFTWQSANSIPAGWHSVQINCFNKAGKVMGNDEGKIFVPHITQFAFISDIDDTIMVSHSATIGKRLKELFFKNPKTRTVFKDVEKHYTLLAAAHTNPHEPNPFFYVSSSEWNLYDYLHTVFQHNRLPEGAFLLNQVKQWFELWKTGKTKHQGKLLRILRILETFPNQQFVLLGDNSQSDPAIYSTLVEKFPQRIFAVYIRNVSEKNIPVTQQLLSAIQNKGVHNLLFKESDEAIQHSKQIGLIG